MWKVPDAKSTISSSSDGFRQTTSSMGVILRCCCCCRWFRPREGIQKSAWRVTQGVPSITVSKHIVRVRPDFKRVHRAMTARQLTGTHSTFVVYVLKSSVPAYSIPHILGIPRSVAASSSRGHQPKSQVLFTIAVRRGASKCRLRTQPPGQHN